MRFLALVLIFFNISVVFSKDQSNEVETFFITYLKNLRQKKFDASKNMMTADYLKKMGGEKGLNRLLEMQDGKKEAPKVKLDIQKGVDEIYLIEIKDALVKHSHYLYKVRKVDGKFKVDGTTFVEE